MGRPKALCDFDGVAALTLILHACREADCAAPTVVLGHAAERISAAVDLAGSRIVHNREPALGQTSSLQCGLRALTADATAFLLFPVDYPLVQAADIAALLEGHAAHPEAQVGALSHEGRRGHPVLVSRALVSPLLDLLPSRGAREVINAPGVRTFYKLSANAGVVIDMDTPEDHRTLLTLYRNRTPTAP